MGLKLDFSGVKDFAELPVGKFFVEVTDGSIARTKTKEEAEEAGQPVPKNPDQPYVRFELTVTDGEYEKQKVWDNVYFFESMNWKLRNFTRQFGIEAEGMEFADADEACEWLLNEGIGRQGQIQIKPPRKGSDQNNVDYPRPTGGTQSLLP